MRRNSPATIGLLIGLAIGAGPASAITVDAPIVNVTGRRIEVLPWFDAIVREAEAHPANTTDEVLWQFALDVEEVATGNHIFTAAPTGLSVDPVWVWWGAPDPWSTSVLAGGGSCWDMPWATYSCYCQTGFGACPGNCDALLEMHPNPCYIGLPQPELVTEASPIKPNTTYRIRVLHYHLDPAVTGVSYLESPPTTITTGWQLPDYEILPVTSVVPTGATLNARVVPRYAATDCWWEYGLTNAYGQITSPQTISAAQGDSYQDVSAMLTGLVGGQNYHFRLVASNQAGTAYSADQVVTTSYTSPIATTLAAEVIGNSVEFTGIVDPRNMTTSYAVQWGETATYDHSIYGGALGASDPVSNVSVVATGFDANKTYHWRLAANSAGGAGYGADAMFTMPVSFAPIVETGEASDITASSAKIHGRINPLGTSGTWYVEYGPSASFGSTQFGGGLVAVSTLSDVAMTLGTLQPDTEYFYRVIGFNANGTSIGATRSFRTSTGASTYADFAKYQCVWITMHYPDFIGGTARRGLARKSSASLTFQGDGIRLWSMRDPTLGRMKVTLDGKRTRTIDLNGPTQYQVNVYEATGLAGGTHTLKVEAAPTKKKLHILVDAVEILD